MTEFSVDMMTCQHRKFISGTRVGYLGKVGSEVAIEIKVRCAECGVPFVFIDPRERNARVSEDRTLLRLPIEPAIAMAVPQPEMTADDPVAGSA